MNTDTEDRPEPQAVMQEAAARLRRINNPNDARLIAHLEILAAEK